ncbi:MAG: alpha/beta hydrolase [Synechococcaceae cyanobacterium]|nr:alpha/beta hydrolase [Synechococcaceae cyanobacterium]
MTVPSTPDPSSPYLHHDWNGHRCAYRVIGDLQASAPPILSLHPIGVGLSGTFWNRFDAEWLRRGQPNALVHPDLLGCGASAMPHQAIHPGDWADQLAGLWRERLQRPVLLIVQGASFPIAIELHDRLPEAIAGMVLAGPPARRLITAPGSPGRSDALWRWFFDTPAGNLFYRYARTSRFLRNFSVKELFDQPQDVDEEWIGMLREGAADMASRYAVFSFLAGWWRRDYSREMAQVRCPVLALFGEHASGIGRTGKGAGDAPASKLEDYPQLLPHARAAIVPGRNVVPWERPGPFAGAVAEWVGALPGGPSQH